MAAQAIEAARTKRNVTAKRRKKLRVGRRRHRLSAVPPIFSETELTAAHVERFFWRTGFGPSAADRQAWVGKSVGELVDTTLNTPNQPLVGPAPMNNKKPLDPLANDTDLVLEWVDRMVRTPTPMVERMTFFWHSLWANSRVDVSPPQLIRAQNDRFRRFGDLGANPAADVRTLALEMATDPAMLRFLTGEANVKGKPNENYAREVMELFLLGVVGPDGKPNYTEDDVKELARAFSGWRIDDKDPNNAKSYFTQSRWDPGMKTVLGKAGAYNERDGTEVVLQHPNHPAHVALKLWEHFVTAPPDAATLASLVRTYQRANLQVKPVVRKILMSAPMYASINEPNMIKPPVVYVAGVIRSLKLGITDDSANRMLTGMGQQPYFPPTVAGWEGGTSWLNSNTVLTRYRFVGDLVATMADLQDVAAETPQAAFDRAYGAVNSPWLSDGGRKALLEYANRAPAKSAAQRKSRQIVLRTLMLAGPDAQVM